MCYSESDSALQLSSVVNDLISRDLGMSSSTSKLQSDMDVFVNIFIESKGLGVVDTSRGWEKFIKAAGWGG